MIFRYYPEINFYAHFWNQNLWKSAVENDFFLVSSNSFMNFDFTNEFKNEFKDNNEKSCSWSRNRISHKIDFKGEWPRNINADRVVVKKRTFIKGSESRIDISEKSRSDPMHSPRAIFLSRFANITIVHAKIIFEIPAASKLVKHVRVKMKHNIE